MAESKIAFEKKMMLKGNVITDHLEFNIYRYIFLDEPNTIHTDVNPPFINLSLSEKTGYKNGMLVNISHYSIATQYNTTFAEGYHKINNAAMTWYNRIETSTEPVIGEIIRHLLGDKKELNIQYSKLSDYQSTLKEILTICEYQGIENNDESESYIQKFKYRDYIITCEQRETAQHIRLHKELK